MCNECTIKYGAGKQRDWETNEGFEMSCRRKLPNVVMNLVTGL